MHNFEFQALKYFFDICKILPEKLRHRMDKSRVFSVQKNSDKNMKNLKKCIASTVKSQSHWGERVPISWTKLESMLKKLREGAKIYLLSDLLRVVLNMNELMIKNEEDLIIALTFFNETGVILFRSEIKNIIILDVQWFVDAFKRIILDKEHMDKKDQFNWADFNDLYEFGLLSTTLLNKLWEDNGFQEYKESLVNHMKQLDMLAELSEDMWYVPCMNKQMYSSEILENCNVSSTLCFLYEYLPFVIYHRLVVACINNLGMQPWIRKGIRCIFHTVTILSCNDQIHRVLIGICQSNERTNRKYPYSIEVQVNSTKRGDKIDTRLTSELRKTIFQNLTNLTQAFPSCDRSFHLGYRCKLEPFRGNQESHIIREEDIREGNPQFDCCKCNENHIVDVNSIICFWEVC